MMHSVLFSIFAATTLATPAATVAPLELHGGEHQKPVIHVSTDWDEYSRGQEAQVTVETRDDGYVIVMQADVDGRVRVLYPLDPGNDNFVRGGHSFDVPGRGGKKSFYVDGPGGTGMVYAAWSSIPFKFDAFVSAGHWDYGALYDKTMDNDFENGFTALVDKMSTGHFDYDIARYTVIAQTSYSEQGAGGGSVVVSGGGCWGPYYAGCFGPAWAPGAYLYGPPFGWASASATTATAGASRSASAIRGTGTAIRTTATDTPTMATAIRVMGIRTIRTIPTIRTTATAIPATAGRTLRIRTLHPASASAIGRALRE